MSERRYQTPAALEQALAERISQRYSAPEFQFRRNEVAYRRLIARMYSVDPDRWVLKGGFAMILRLDPNRTSNDVDVTYVAAAGEQAMALQALERAIELDLDDFFSFEILRVSEATEESARRVTVLCRLGAREFARFRVDLACPQPDVPSERIQAPPLSGLDEVDAMPPLLVLAWSQQIADKVCAIFEVHPRGFSSRARDVADLGLIARQVDRLEGSSLIEALRAEEARRRPRSLPEGLPSSFVLSKEQEQEWRTTFSRASRGAPITFDEALGLAAGFINPLLNGSAAGLTWSADAQAYAALGMPE